MFEKEDALAYIQRLKDVNTPEERANNPVYRIWTAQMSPTLEAFHEKYLFYGFQGFLQESNETHLALLSIWGYIK